MKAFSRLQLEAIIRAIPTALLVIEKKDSKVIFANDKATKLFGIDLNGFEVPIQTETLGKIMTLEGQQYPFEQRPIWRALLKGQEVQDEFIIQRPDGSRRVVSATARPITVDDGGMIIAAVAVYEDITERKVFEESLAEERQTLSAVIESTETMIAFLDLDFNFVVVNNAYAKGSGYSVDGLIGKNHFKLFPDSENQAIFERVRDTGKPVLFLDKPFEFANQPNRGVTYWDWTLTPAKDEAGNGIGLVLTLMETTQRKKAVDALHKSEERFRLVAEAANVLVYELEVDNNKSTIIRGEEVLGYRKGEIPTTVEWWFAQVHPEDKSSTKIKLQNAIETCTDVLLEYRMKRKQGDYIFVHDRIKVLCSEQGRATRLVGGIRDVTERKKTEETVKEYTKRLELAQHVARLGSWEFYVREDRAVWSKELFHMFNRKPEENAPNITEYSKLIHPDDLKDVADRMQRFIAKGKLGETISFDYRIPQPDGLVRYLHTERMIISVDSNGKSEHIIGIEQDITGRKKAQEQLEQYAKQMEELANQRAKKLQDAERLATIGETAGMVGHDIRNPLQAITGDIYLLKGGLNELPDGEAKRSMLEDLDAVEQNLFYIDKIVGDLQDYTRPLNPKVVATDMEKLIKSQISSFVPKTIKSTLKIEPEAQKLMTDPGILKRVIMNLLTNAVQAMKVGGKLTVTAKKDVKFYVLSVEDTGVGIPDNIKSKLFTPMFTTKSKGQGFGLPVIKRMTEALGGTVTFESEEGKGTKFSIKLPA